MAPFCRTHSTTHSHTMAKAHRTTSWRCHAHIFPLGRHIRARRRHEPLCDAHVPIPTRTQKCSVAILRANAASVTVDAKTAPASSSHRTHIAPLGRCIRSRRRHQPLRDGQVPVLTCNQKRGAPFLQAVITRDTVSIPSRDSHTVTRQVHTHLGSLRHCARPRRRHQPPSDRDVPPLAGTMQRCAADLLSIPHEDIARSQTARLRDAHACSWKARTSVRSEPSRIADLHWRWSRTNVSSIDTSPTRHAACSGASATFECEAPTHR